ncbi:MAG: mutual gliding-motility protein MglA [Thermoanaerobaculia bacterium]|jgi:signal recognition particle receptor subunit beta|nr:mutual gliding-motility protein MglA [Thermoanaerobaculia bacterium]
MVLINKAINEVTVKLVYYGPGLCGKTTNLEKIYGNPKLDNKGKMISMSTETDRTLFFDFMPMELGTIGGQKVRVQLYTVPGQVFYDATRKLVLRGADGVVFVADSQSSMRDSNLDSLENLKTNLRINRIDPQKVALVLQYNKRDLPNVDSVETMNGYLNPNGAPAVEASAITGQGVTATLRAAVGRILDNLKNNVDTTLHEEPELEAPDMSAKSGVTPMSAGTPKLSMKSTPAFDAEETVTVSPFEVAPIEVTVEEEDPFGDMPAVEVLADPIDDPFAAPAAEVHDAGELQSLLASAQEVVRSLETALERAKAHEAALREKLS